MLALAIAMGTVVWAIARHRAADVRSGGRHSHRATRRGPGECPCPSLRGPPSLSGHSARMSVRAARPPLGQIGAAREVDDAAFASSRSSSRQTLAACQGPPRAVRTPRAFSAAASCASVVHPALRAASMYGLTWAARPAAWRCFAAAA
jgi:hypothetical protein